MKTSLIHAGVVALILASAATAASAHSRGLANVAVHTPVANANVNVGGKAATRARS